MEEFAHSSMDTDRYAGSVILELSRIEILEQKIREVTMEGDPDGIIFELEDELDELRGVAFNMTNSAMPAIKEGCQEKVTMWNGIEFDPNSAASLWMVDDSESLKRELNEIYAARGMEVPYKMEYLIEKSIQEPQIEAESDEDSFFWDAEALQNPEQVLYETAKKAYNDKVKARSVLVMPVPMIPFEESFQFEQLKTEGFYEPSKDFPSGIPKLIFDTKTTSPLVTGEYLSYGEIYGRKLFSINEVLRYQDYHTKLCTSVNWLNVH